ncbi:hypothetical protein AWENTII_008844 [Aspergillus wentii]
MRPFGEFPVCGAEENPKKWKRILTRGSGHGLTTDPWLAMLLPQLTRLERLEVSFDADSTFTLLLLPKVIAMRNEIDTPLSGGILNSLKDFRGVCVENEWEPSTGKREVTPINDCFLHLPSLRSFHAVHDILPRSELAKKPVLDFTELDIHLCPETWKTKYRDLLSHHKDSLRELIFLPFNREFDPDMSDLSEDEYEGEEVYEDHPLHNEFIGSLSQFTVLKEIHLRTHIILESEDSDLSRDQRQLIHNLPTSLEKLDIDELTDIGPHETRRLIAQLEQLVSQAGQKFLRHKQIQIAGEFPDTPQDDDEPWPEDVALYTDGVWDEGLIDTQLVSDMKQLCRICEEKNVLFTLCYPLLDPGLFEKIQIDLT